MSPVARRRTAIVIFVVMLGLAALNLILSSLGRDDWLLVGGALGVAIGSLTQVLTVTKSGKRVALTARGRVAVVSLSVVAAVSLVIAGVSGGLAVTWFIAGLFLVGLVFTVVGVLRQGGKHVDQQQGQA